VPHRNLDVVILCTDGSTAGKIGPGAWAAILVYGTHEKEISGYFPDGCGNGRMELMAVCEGLKTLKRSCRVRVISDSEYVVKGINTWLGQWVKKNWRTNTGKEPKHRDLWEQILYYKKIHSIEAVWERGHAGHHLNERADKIARGLRESHKNASSASA
jgi:ribonuclease HI